MDWAGLGIEERVLKWLRATDSERYARDVRLDPFATSMRDFDDVSPNLHALRDGKEPAVNDPAQRLTDLRGAHLVTADNKLSDLGRATLSAWEKYNVASAVKSDELARHLLLVLEAKKLNSADYKVYQDYWAALSSAFDPVDLMDNWDALYTINYLDYVRDDFAPGQTIRTEKPDISDIEFDLVDLARSAGDEAATSGAAKIENAIAGKVPRGRHRSTFCMALEIERSAGASAEAILDRLGVPKRPRTWSPFSEQQKIKIKTILADYQIDVQPAAAPATSAPSVAKIPSDKQSPISLPSNIDFSKALVAPPQVPKRAVATAGKSTPKKIDHLKKAERTSSIGALAEKFALDFERWRLRDHPDLLAKLRQVSETDDALGYDIESFELDGTPRYIEVKGTLGPIETRFFLSANELECAKSLGSKYLIFRAGELETAPKFCELRYPFSETEMFAETYQVTFKTSD